MTLKNILQILVIVLFLCSCNYCYCQDTLEYNPGGHTMAAINIGFTYQTKDNQNLSTKIFELGTELELTRHNYNKKIIWDGFDSNGNRTGGVKYVGSFVNIFRVSGLFYQSNEPAFGLLIGDRIRPAYSFNNFVVGLNFITNTDFFKYKLIFRPEIGVSFFKRHRFNLMVGLDLPINKVSFKYYNKTSFQLIFNYRIFNRIINNSGKVKTKQ